MDRTKVEVHGGDGEAGTETKPGVVGHRTALLTDKNSGKNNNNNNNICTKS